jgi:hypothetical protein
VAYLRGIDDDQTAGIDEEIYIASDGQGRLSQLLVKAAVLSQNSAAPDDGHSLGQFDGHRPEADSRFPAQAPFVRNAGGSASRASTKCLPGDCGTISRRQA